MKKILKTSFTAVLAALVLSLSVLTAFAAKDELTVNDEAKAKKGDTITYTLNMGDCTEKVEGLQMQLMYDNEYLEIDGDSVKFDNLSDAVSNTKLENIIPFNWTNAANLADFSKTKPIISVDFKVKKAGETTITYFVTEMYGSDLTYLKSFTLTNDIAVNGKTVVKGAAPIVNENGALRNQYQGSFINYSDGKGEENGSGENHVAVTGVTEAATAANEVVDVTQGEDNTVTIITIVSIIVVILAIAAVVILRNHFTKKPEDK